MPTKSFSSPKSNFSINYSTKFNCMKTKITISKKMFAFLMLFSLLNVSNLLAQSPEVQEVPAGGD